MSTSLLRLQELADAIIVSLDVSLCEGLLIVHFADGIVQRCEPSNLSSAPPSEVQAYALAILELLATRIRNGSLSVRYSGGVVSYIETRAVYRPKAAPRLQPLDNAPSMRAF